MTKYLLKIILVTIILIHYTIFSFIVGMPFLMLVQGHWIGLGASILFCLWKGFMPIECPLSSLECAIERKLELRECHKFVKGWISPENAKKNWINLIKGNKYTPIDKSK